MKNGKPQSMRRFFRSPVLPLQTALLFVMLSLAVVQAKTIDCPGIAVPGTTDMQANIVDKYTGVGYPNGVTVAPYTFIKIHSRAEAQGLCYGQAEVEGACVLTGMVYERTVNHTEVYANIVSTALNGNYFIGNVYGSGTPVHVLDTHNANTSGPNQAMLPYPGSYTYSIKAYINTTPCEIDPDQTDTVTITLYVSGSDEEEAAIVLAQAPRRLPDNYIRIRNSGLFGNDWSWLFNKPAVL